MESRDRQRHLRRIETSTVCANLEGLSMAKVRGLKASPERCATREPLLQCLGRTPLGKLATPNASVAKDPDGIVVRRWPTFGDSPCCAQVSNGRLEIVNVEVSCGCLNVHLPCAFFVPDRVKPVSQQFAYVRQRLIKTLLPGSLRRRL